MGQNEDACTRSFDDLEGSGGGTASRRRHQIGGATVTDIRRCHGCDGSRSPYLRQIGLIRRGLEDLESVPSLELPPPHEFEVRLGHLSDIRETLDLSGVANTPHLCDEFLCVSLQIRGFLQRQVAADRRSTPNLQSTA